MVSKGQSQTHERSEECCPEGITRSPGLFMFFDQSFSSGVMLFSPVRIVDPLWSSADDAGGRIPRTPKAIRAPLNPTIKR